MKLQKIILCVAVALTAFGVSLGLLEIGSYLRIVCQPLKPEVKTIKPIPSPSVVYVPPIEKYEQPVGVPKVDVKRNDEPSCEFCKTGHYAIFDENPKGFEDFDYLTVINSRFDLGGYQFVEIKPKGSLFTTKEFNFSWINITGKQISFVTQTRKGLSYQFDGKFVNEKIKVKDGDGGEYDGEILLKGRLTKWRNGVRSAEAKVKFTGLSGC